MASLSLREGGRFMTVAAESMELSFHVLWGSSGSCTFTVPGSLGRSVHQVVVFLILSITNNSPVLRSSKTVDKLALLEI